jgi:hypothetical protein
LAQVSVSALAAIVAVLALSSLAQAEWSGTLSVAPRPASSSLLETVKKKHGQRHSNNPSLNQNNPSLKQDTNPAINQDSASEHDCGEGYIALDHPNKYGAYCEFVPVPGCPKDYVGTPPNCEYCPNGKTKEGICFF